MRRARKTSLEGEAHSSRRDEEHYGIRQKE